MRGIALALAASLAVPAVAAAEAPAACPPAPVRVVRSAGGVIDYFGHVPGIPELCRLRRSDGASEFYFGVWRSDWPGAGQAYPALRATIHGPPGTRTEFITRSVPGLQWTDRYVNEGVESVTVGRVAYRTLRLAHEREGIEGNTYHSVITQWRDLATGMTLKQVEYQISGQSYGPEATWQAVRVKRLP